MRKNSIVFVLASAVAVLTISSATAGDAGEGEKGSELRDNPIALQLLRKGEELLSQKEEDRGIKMLETIVEQYPSSLTRYKAQLALGRYSVETKKYSQAINYLRPAVAMKRSDKPIEGAQLDLYVEALYRTGVAYFQTHQYESAFPFLRTVTNDYPNRVWANESYYYIGMGHFNQGNWDKAIKALNLVGTFVDPQSPTADLVEAGRRIYIKVSDGDLPVLMRQGRQVTVSIETSSGDVEEVSCVPMAGKGDVWIASIASEIGKPKKNDGVLQVVGGDELTIKYRDENTKSGAKDVIRETHSKVVSTARLSFTLGDFKRTADAAFLDQPLYVVLTDADCQNETTVEVVSRFKKPAEEDAPAPESATETVKYITRDELTVHLKELTPQHRTGIFAGSIRVQSHQESKPVDHAALELESKVGDEIVVSYIDERHIAGNTPREVLAKTQVVGELDTRPRAKTYVVTDPVLSAQKGLVEATAFLELGRLFKSMGLMKGAISKCDEGLALVDPIIAEKAPLPSNLSEQAFKAKWELLMVKNDVDGAIATCLLFNRLYPDSPFADEALMGIGKLKFETKDFAGASAIFNRVLSLDTSRARAEAQFMIARCVEAQAKGDPKAAILYYKQCAQRYPRSEFAGSALSKLVDYYVDTRDYAQASDLLEQIFQDYPDASFLDDMLFKWVIVAYRMKDYAKARDKCSQLLSEYPSSPHSQKAQQFLTKIEAQLGGGEDSNKASTKK